MTHTLPIDSFEEKKSTGECAKPFFFKIPSSCPEFVGDQSTCCSKGHEQHYLPPSMEATRPVSTAYTTEIPGGGSTLRLHRCRITYSITARMWKGGEVIAEISREWKYLPVAKASPPITTTDFPGEYQLYAKTVAADIRRLRIYGLLSIQIEQPHRFLIRHADMKTSSLVMPAKLRLGYQDQHDVVEVNCALSLETYTFYSTKSQGAILPQLHKLPRLAVAESSKRVLPECSTSGLTWHRANGTQFFQTSDIFEPAFQFLQRN